MESYERKIWVIGHKNPDTDSICSAIAYSDLKNKLYGNHYVPKRAGHMNRETKFVLKYFEVEAPELVFDVGTQVKDIEIRRAAGVESDLSLKKAWEMMKQQQVETLPVTKKAKLAGLITVADIAGAYMSILDNRILAEAKTPVKNIVETLDGTMVCGDSNGVFSEGTVLIAADNPDFMEHYISEHDLVILGNRYEGQLCAIEMGADLIVVCEGAPVSLTIRKLAQEHQCRIISTPYDTFTVARLINQSMPIGYFMTRDRLVTFRTDDSMEEVRDTMARLRHRYFPVLDSQGLYYGMISRRNLLGMKRKQIILVDHNEPSQAADGVGQAEVLEIIDHHRLGTVETTGPVFFWNEPVGCTATIVYQMYENAHVPIDRQTAGLLVSAIISDTLLFRSPTCTKRDEQVAAKLATIAGINLEKYAMEMFAASSHYEDMTVQQIFRQDYKEFSIGQKAVGIGQISCASKTELAALKERLIPYLPAAMEEQHMEQVFFMLTGILDQDTELLCFGKGSRLLAEIAFPQAEKREESLLLSGVVSRKKQMVPALTQAAEADG